jgi:hypothetical protein
MNKFYLIFIKVGLSGKFLLVLASAVNGTHDHNFALSKNVTRFEIGLHLRWYGRGQATTGHPLLLRVTREDIHSLTGPLSHTDTHTSTHSRLNLYKSVILLYKIVTFLLLVFPAADLQENSPRYYVMYSTILREPTTGTSVVAICKY